MSRIRLKQYKLITKHKNNIFGNLKVAFQPGRKKWRLNQKKLIPSWKQNILISTPTPFPNSQKLFFKNRLQKKQERKHFYGKISEKSFKKLLLISKSKKKNNINKLNRIFETRLDIILYRSMRVKSIYEAKQKINHGYFLLNNKPIYSNQKKVQKNDIISVKPEYVNKFKTKILYEKIKLEYYLSLNQLNKSNSFFLRPTYLEYDFSKNTLNIIKIRSIKNEEIYYTFKNDLQNIINVDV